MATEVAAGDAAANEASAKSALTTMLAENPETSRIHEIFGAVPRKPGGEREHPPLETLQVPRGTDFYLNFGMTAAVSLITAYFFTVGIGLVMTLVNMMGGTCGQEIWMQDSDIACPQMLVNNMALSIELRCYGERPANMTADTFDSACGGGAWIEAIIAMSLAAMYAYGNMKSALGKLPSQVLLYEHYFVLESWNRERFTGCFYGDVTSAKVGMTGLEIATKAKCELHAGGEDESQKKKGRTLNVTGDGAVSVLAGHGAEQKAFVEAFAKHLPIKIEGYDGAAKAPQEGALSLLEGNFGTILKARKGTLGETVSIRKPFSCDFASEAIIIALIVVGCWYFMATFSKCIGWAIGKATGKCIDPMRPGVDLCAVWRIFMPLDIPLVNASDYINIVLLICTLIGLPAYSICTMPKEYKFHSQTLLEECLLAGWESQEATMVFASDIQGAELYDGSLEKYVTIQTKAVYTVTGGVEKPVTIKAVYSPGEAAKVKVGIVDASCASCSGQGDQARAYRSSIVENVNKLKPGCLSDPAEAPSI